MPQLSQRQRRRPRSQEKQKKQQQQLQQLQLNIQPYQTKRKSRWPRRQMKARRRGREQARAEVREDAASAEGRWVELLLHSALPRGGQDIAHATRLLSTAINHKNL
mmetsp:Transcript_11059/g.24593  ORF Transcript_11059/g.24593 Transcript_11059/m.24593 type:complete len:106 (+) Transcript_11059:704-1021(+)